ncbi:MAG: hypothetical protein IPQ07_14185 [Myxococcales bacterium]|nr:hypothetical protein [Myxococcales bacterium]
MRALWLVVLMGCWSGGKPTEVPPTPPSAAPIENHAPPPAQPACPTIDPKDLATLGSKTDEIRPLELDGDPLTVEVAVEDDCSSPLRCAYKIYARRGDCWISLGKTGDLMGEPGCERGSPKGTYCTLSGMRLMIHGDAQEYLYNFTGGVYGDEQPGTRYVPGPSKRP